jgi:ABC-2 type transport system permease protein
MKKYHRFVIIPISELLTNRLKILVWRIRVIISTLTLFFLWNSVLPRNHSIGPYTQSAMLTYILVGSFISNITIGSRSFSLGDTINNGDLSNYLLKPINYFIAFFLDDVGGKGADTILSICELTVLFIILKPDLMIQTNIFYIFSFSIAIILGMLLYFFFGILLSSIAFWSSEVWGPKFLFNTLTVFLGGAIFPLDIVPKGLYTVVMLSPFPYLTFFPIKVYLGQLSTEQISIGFAIACFWIISLYYLSKTVWRKGLLMYASAGR